MLIKNVMITDVVSVKKDSAIKELLKTLVTNHIGGVPVIDQDGYLTGMTSDGDVIRYLQPKGRNIYDAFYMVFFNEKMTFEESVETRMQQEVQEIMKKNIYTVYPDDSIEQALSIFAGHHFKKIPVIDHSNTVVGVVSRGDIMRMISNQIITHDNDQ
ncbi:CBS domain-containing protein [Barrientosiimonas marina]|uniref:CBS domain-containing protein n=1 Tax=Lentibacillus kimchii TaxID=1542911 RepID=A0ABW2UWH1_9BACI